MLIDIEKTPLIYCFLKTTNISMSSQDTVFVLFLLERERDDVHVCINKRYKNNRMKKKLQKI